MGTRGCFGFVIEGEEKLAYNQFDSYPSGRGVEVLRWAREASLDDVRKQAKALRVVSEDTPPTPEEIERLEEFHDAGVSTGSPTEWYSLLRNTQGDMAEILRAGYVEDASGFPLDSLFCEWAYVVDLDEEQLEVYRGFVKEPHQSGRFAERLKPEDTHSLGAAHNPDDCYRCGAKKGSAELKRACPQAYWPVELVASYPLVDLPTDDQFLKELKEDDG